MARLGAAWGFLMGHDLGTGFLWAYLEPTSSVENSSCFLKIKSVENCLCF